MHRASAAVRARTADRSPHRPYDGAVLRCLVAIALAGCGACGDEDDPPGDGAASCSSPAGEKSGEATYYAADGTGNCSFPASSDRMVAAINATDYATAAWCGACVAVTGPTGTVTVRVVDKCPGCDPGDLDLSSEAFARISPLSAGRVQITWREVACDVQGPLSYHFKDGSSAFWTAIQVRNHRYPIAKIEAGTAGTLQTIERVSYNYFIETSGLGAGPYTIRVTDTRGQVAEDTGIAIADDATRTGTAQHPICP
ncbi:MAG: hypothetical protein H0T42_08975 [Deltaproteobacteria bacterium]|nr:hypothetical protein [Deltaproteobacteria bacterium]